MKIIHRVAVSASDAQIEVLSDHGIEYKQLGGRSILFLLDEAHAAWPVIAPLIAKWGASDLIMTEFDREELTAAQYLRMRPAWHCGYPMPDDDNGYMQITYDDKDYCTECGIGLKQQSPFRMSREPRWGSKQILQLNWVMDEFFATPEAWEHVFKPFGVDCLPVIGHRTGRPLNAVIQLRVTSMSTPVGEPGGFLRETCPTCKREKMCGTSPGRFPHVELMTNTHMAKTPDYFGPRPGDGPVAWHKIIISAALYKAIVSHKLKGAEFETVAAVGQPRI